MPIDHLPWFSPTTAWLCGSWHVTHSTLPMWQTKRNVCIQYTPLAPSSPGISEDMADRLLDVVTYQELHSDKVVTIRGIDEAASTGDSRGEWDWREKGWLMIASSHWEVLGWGEEGEKSSGNGNKWALTLFAETIFTRAGIDFYCQMNRGVTPETLSSVKTALAAINDVEISVEIRHMANDLFEVRVDGLERDI